jgi:hypothetical protein
MIAGVGIVLIYSLLFGYYELRCLDGTYSFVGAFASKNQLGFYASLGLIVCLPPCSSSASGVCGWPLPGSSGCCRPIA